MKKDLGKRKEKSLATISDKFLEIFQGCESGIDIKLDETAECLGKFLFCNLFILLNFS